MVKTMYNMMEKAPPAMVATGLVNRLVTAIKNNVSVMRPSPTGICTPRIVKLNGTWNSRWPGFV